MLTRSPSFVLLNLLVSAVATNSITVVTDMYCHLNDLIAGTVLLLIQTTIVPICIWYIDQPIALIRLLSPPDARTVLLPESDNCRVNTPATQTDNDYAAVTIVDWTIMPVRLQSTDQMIVLIRLRSTDRMIMPVRLQLTDRLVDKLYA